MIKRIILKLYNPIINRLASIESVLTVSQNTVILNQNIARGNASSCLRQLDEKNPHTWEFSGFSQNGEDGIIDFLTRKLKSENKYFVEIGASNGLENNSAWLASVRKYSGLMIDGSSEAINKAKLIQHNLGVEYECIFVDAENILTLKNKLLFHNPDVFSLDIDGNDYYLAKTILDSGIRPKIFVVEYNSAYGPHNSLTIEYDKDFYYGKNDDSYIYYGVSITGWKTMFKKHDYHFVGVDSNGVNGFFIDKREFEPEFYNNINVVNYRENFFQLKNFRTTWEAQFNLIRNKPLFEIN